MAEAVPVQSELVDAPSDDVGGPSPLESRAGEEQPFEFWGATTEASPIGDFAQRRCLGPQRVAGPRPGSRRPCGLAHRLGSSSNAGLGGPIGRIR